MMLPWAIVAGRRRTSASTATTRSEREHQRASTSASAFLPENQDPTLAPARRPGATAVSHGSDARVPRLRRDPAAVGPRLADVPLPAAVVQPPLQQRLLVRLQRHDQRSTTIRPRARACSTTPTGPTRSASDQAEADELLGDRRSPSPRHEGELRLGPAGHPSSRQRCSAHRACSSTTGSCRDVDGAHRERRTPSASATRTAAAT